MRYTVDCRPMLYAAEKAALCADAHAAGMPVSIYVERFVLTGRRVIVLDLDTLNDFAQKWDEFSIAIGEFIAELIENACVRRESVRRICTVCGRVEQTLCSMRKGYV